MGSNNEFSLWVVVLNAFYEAKITSYLLNAGYTISPLSDSKIVTKPSNNNGISSVVALRIQTDSKITGVTLRDNIKKNLDLVEVKYFAIILGNSSGGAWWSSGNVYPIEPTPLDLGSPYRNKPI